MATDDHGPSADETARRAADALRSRCGVDRFDVAVVLGSGWSEVAGALGDPLWEGAAAMVAFRNSGAHRSAMPKLGRICDEASYAHWDQTDAAPPSPAEAALRLASAGRLSQVRHPSADQIAGRTWPDGMAPTPRRRLEPRLQAAVAVGSSARR